MGSAHDLFLDLALHVAWPVADVVERRSLGFYRHVAVVVRQEVVDDGVTDLDLLVGELSTLECVVSAPIVAQDGAKLDVGLMWVQVTSPRRKLPSTLSMMRYRRLMSASRMCW